MGILSIHIWIPLTDSLTGGTVQYSTVCPRKSRPRHMERPLINFLNMVVIFISILIKKRDLSVCLSVCLSGYAFRRALTNHAEILHSDRGHIFRKYRHKNNKKVSLLYEKTVKNRPLPGNLPPVAMHRIACVSRVSARTLLWRFAYAQYV